MAEEQAKWYVVHTYSGYENKVKDSLEKSVENRGMQEFIQEIRVPMEEVIEMRNGKKKVVQRKIFPGYVILKMIMTDDSWYIVRNTRGVTGFVGPGSKPIPLSPAEIKNMGIEDRKATIDVDVNDSVKIMTGPFDGSIGLVKEVHAAKGTVIVMLSIFGRETPVEIDFDQIEKV